MTTNTLSQQVIEVINSRDAVALSQILIEVITKSSSGILSQIVIELITTNDGAMPSIRPVLFVQT